MTGIESIILGMIQGLTEFLPVSSSGHLVIFQHLMQFESPQLVFDVALHFATLFAVFSFFFKDIIKLRKYEIWLILIGTVPAGLVGVLLNDYVEGAFASVKLVSLFLMITGLINFLIDKIISDEKLLLTLTNMKVSQSLKIGLFQAVAILPGISRSGSTILGGSLVGLKRIDAFKFSFLLSIPAILGATGIQLIKVIRVSQGSFFDLELLLGSLAAFIAGLISLKILKYVIQKASFKIFGYYCLLFGFISLLLI